MSDETTNAENGKKPDHEPPAGAETTGSWGRGRKAIQYTATGKWTVLRKKEKPAAEIFSVSYVAAGDDRNRPLTFVFNGGPGAASAYLHMGAVGPQRVAFPPDGTLPTVPARLVENESSWLAFSDLVFVDPVGTGFSRVIEQDKKGDGKEGGEARRRRARSEGVLRLQARPRVAVRVHGTVALRARPLGLAGLHRRRELRRLPGRTPRAAAPGVGRHRPERRDPHLARARARRPRADRLRRPAAGSTVSRRWPPRRSTTAKSRAFRKGTSLEKALRAAEEFATGDYAVFLTRGAVAAGEGAHAHPLASSPTSSDSRSTSSLRAEGRVGILTFVRELLRDERKVLGLYDTTITATDPFPDRDGFRVAGSDAVRASARRTPLAVNRMLRSEIGVETDREYTLLSYEVNLAWKNDAEHHAFAPPPGATDDFRYGMALNPHMHAFITHGQYDLVTPYYTSDRLRNLMKLDPQMADRLTVQHYGGGHMFYAWETSRLAFTAAIAAFVANAS